jgi:gliding motility-associated-like protein
VENEEDVFFMNTSTGEQQKEWSWHFINNSGGRSDEQNPSYLFKAAGVYPVAMVVTNTWGCSDTLVRQIEVLPDFSVYIPNAFTPDGDGRNDAFYAKGTGIKTYSLVVFDRWGEKLFSTTDAKVTWDGSYKGRECKNDTYVWKLRVSGINGKVKEMAGQVLLLR